MNLEMATTLIHNAGWIFLHAMVGLGAGFIFGLLVANRIWGRGQPTLVQAHQEHAAAAGEHNKLLSPTHPRWEKL